MADVKVRLITTEQGSSNVDKLNKSIDRLAPSANDAQNAARGIGRELLSLGSTGSANFEAIAMSATSLLGPLGLVAGAVVAIGAATVGAVNTAIEWFKEVDQLSDITGMGIEFASVFATGADLAGADAQRMGMSIAQLNQRLADSDKAAATAARGMSRATLQMSRAYEDHVERVTDLGEQRADKLAELDEKVVDAHASYLDSLTEAEEDYHERVAELEESLADAREDYDIQRARRQRRLKEQLAGIDEDDAKERAKIQAQFANANTELGKKALAAELAALDERTREERDKLTASATEEETEDQRQQDKRLSRLQRSIAKEDKEYSKQTDKLFIEYQKRVDEWNDSQAEIEEATTKALDREAKQYARTTADIEQSMADMAAQVDEAGNSAARALEAMNIKVDEWKAAKPEDQAKLLIDGLNGIEDSGDRALAAMGALGKYGAGEWLDMARIVQKDGWGGLLQTAKEYGQYIDEPFAKQAQAFIDQQNRIDTALKGAAIRMGKQVIPAFMTFGAVLEMFGKGDFTGGFEGLNQLLVNFFTDLDRNMPEWWQNLFYGGINPNGPPTTTSHIENYNFSPNYTGTPNNVTGDFNTLRALGNTP